MDYTRWDLFLDYKDGSIRDHQSMLNTTFTEWWEWEETIISSGIEKTFDKNVYK